MAPKQSKPLVFEPHNYDSCEYSVCSLPYGKPFRGQDGWYRRCCPSDHTYHHQVYAEEIGWITIKQLGLAAIKAFTNLDAFRKKFLEQPDLKATAEDLEEDKVIVAEPKKRKTVSAAEKAKKMAEPVRNIDISKSKAGKEAVRRGFMQVVEKHAAKGSHMVIKGKLTNGGLLVHGSKTPGRHRLLTNKSGEDVHLDGFLDVLPDYLEQVKFSRAGGKNYRDEVLSMLHGWSSSFTEFVGDIIQIVLELKQAIRSLS